ncbi:hypothetical protein TNCT_62931 [Trichonephila clavata]|uniref:Uncharacterized protein n=1 Tax=Trichonephila clavata TaxID=2740835 RepID=A0A8X6LU70_TRICU|nr:hypothetical protein TNCT_62931 [Trichonephila clavata]
MQECSAFDYDIPLTMKNGLVRFHDVAVNRSDGFRLAQNLLVVLLSDVLCRVKRACVESRQWGRKRQSYTAVD